MKPWMKVSKICILKGMLTVLATIIIIILSITLIIPINAKDDLCHF